MIFMLKWCSKFRLLLPLFVLCFLGFLVNSPTSYFTTTLDVCFPKNNIVFLKTHKCAGSSIQNILMRYGDAQKLNFVLPKTGNYMGHPTPFNRAMVMKPLLPVYNILAHHTRLDYREIHSFMPVDSLYVTIIRDPIEVFESAYSYYGLDRFWGGNLHSFIAKIPKLHKHDIHRRLQNKFGSNQMMFDLGADPSIFNNDSLVEHYIDKLDSWFDLVLISNRMDESLVLLKHLMCWNMDDVITFKLNSRDPKFKSNLTEKERKALSDLNRADHLLYRHFLKKFEKAIDAFGREKMEEDIQELRERTQKWYDFCVKSEQRHGKPTAKPKYYFNPKVLVFKPNKDVRNETCKTLTIEELPYTDILRSRQKNKALKGISTLWQNRSLPVSNLTIQDTAVKNIQKNY